MPKEKDEMSEGQSAIFQQGTDVGMLAQQLFPDGVDATPASYYEFQQSVADTAKYISEGHTVIYEAAFQYDGILAAIDMLVKKKGKWYAYEVKSSTSVKPPFIQDAALQYYVITHSGIPLKDISIVHLNNQYVRFGALDVQQLFTTTSILENVLEVQDFTETQIAELKKVLKLKTAPDISMGKHCHKPYDCDFIGYCSKDVEEGEPDYGAPNINKKALKEFIKELEYPLYFMDFETWMTAVPEYDGHWPYRQIPFQFSVHKQIAPNKSPEHLDYLAEGPHSPQQEFTEKLLEILGENGSIIVYNKSFENTRLKELKEDFPHLVDAISQLQERMIDLMSPFRSKLYYLPEMRGSYSIKYVLPALIPELSYSDLIISNGGDASATFYNLRNEVDKKKINETREALLEYCGLDTLAMVKILEKIKEVNLK